MDMVSPIKAPKDPSWFQIEACSIDGWDKDLPPLEGKVSADVVIVGGGYTGLWTALALHERVPTLSIALIESAICGARASSKNAGQVGGYWPSLSSAAATIGDDGALAIARAGSKAQAGIRAFAQSCGHDLWWREDGTIKVSASPAQDAKLSRYVTEARRLGVPDMAIALTPHEMQARCASPVFRGGVYFPEAGTVHPARLVRSLREAACAAGIKIYEHSPLVALDPGRKSILKTPKGQLEAPEVVLATNTSLAKYRLIRKHLTLFSSYALITEPAPDRLRLINWVGEEGISDARMFVHYSRRTPDGRVVMGSGAGPIAFGSQHTAPCLTGDLATAKRAERGLRRLLPGLGDIGIDHIWGGGLDVSSDRLPFFRTFPNTRVHYGCGYSGHGVNAAWIGGQCLASLVLNAQDEWTKLPFCTRRPPRMPPEPFRYIGGSVIRSAIIKCEESEERGSVASIFARSIAALPALLGLRIGVR